MTAPTLRDLIGVSAALATPFDARGDVDWARLADHARALLDEGMAVVTAFGTTGEGVSIPMPARESLYDHLGAHGVPAGRLVECIYGPAAADAGRHMRRALGYGVRGFLLTPPFYYKDPDDAAVAAWFAEALEAAGPAVRDVLLYNIPQLTGVKVGPGVVARLRSDFPGVVAGVKDSGGDFAHTEQLLAEHRDLAILVGHEGQLARAVRLGACGSISGMANLAPKLVARLVAGEDEPAIDEALRRILALPVIPAIKAALAALSGDERWRAVKPPLTAIDSDRGRAMVDEVAAILAPWRT